MKTIFTSFLFLFSPLFADMNAAYPPNPFDAEGKTSPAFSQANAQAIYWINLIDQQQFGASWLEAGSLVKDVTTQKQWAAAMAETRSSLGPVTSRKVATHRIIDVLPGGTLGNFMIITYETNYSRQPNMVETVTLMSEGRLGQWKVISYNISRRR